MIAINQLPRFANFLDDEIALVTLHNPINLTGFVTPGTTTNR
jgi:hypothetical protein